MPAPVRPLFDSELEQPLKRFPGNPSFNRENLQDVRTMLNSMNSTKAMLKDPD